MCWFVYIYICVCGCVVACWLVAFDCFACVRAELFVCVCLFVCLRVCARSCLCACMVIALFLVS